MVSTAQYRYSPLGGAPTRQLCCTPCRLRRWRKGGLLCMLIALVLFCVLMLTLYCSPVVRQAQSHQFICYPISFDWSKLVQIPRFEQINFGIGSLVGDMMGGKVNPVSSKTELVHAENMMEGQSEVFGTNPPRFYHKNKAIVDLSRQSSSVKNESNKMSKTNNLQMKKVHTSYKNRSDLVEPNNPNKILLAKPITTEIMKNFEELRKNIEVLNREQSVMNIDKFGPLTNDSILIIIQAHKRVEYFRELIKSLENNKFISDTLIVVSHGFYSSEMNDVVKNIKFTRVLQIFFPFSLQTHTNSFPGISPTDCSREFTKEESEKNNCTWSPRNAKEQQLKHHWWWKANYVFDHLQVTRHFNGLVFFLEEDHYVLPDLLHMLKLMRAIAPKECPDCNIFGLGLNPGSVLNYRDRSDKLQMVQWNNMGFAFDREFWTGLSSEKCANMFCEYNDYNWDFTLAYLSHQCLPHELKPLNVLSPRVFHIGDCGMHFHGNNCSAMEALRGTKELEAEVLPYLFPSEVHVTNTDFKQMRVDGRNGGWSDPRDVALCKTFAGLQPPNDIQMN